MTSNRCKCPPEKRQWYVTQRKYRCSAFDGYLQRSSDYSTIRCFTPGCVGLWHTKARYVDNLPDAPEFWYQH